MVPRAAALLSAAVPLTRLRTRLGKVPAWADGLQLGVFLLALMQAGTLLGHLLYHDPTDQMVPQSIPQLLILPSLLVPVAVLLGRTGTAAVVALIPAAAATYQVGGTGGEMAGFFFSRTFEVSSPGSSFLNAPAQFWMIAMGSAVLAVHGRTRGPLPRRSWWWLMIPLLEAAFTFYTLTLTPVSRDPAVPPHSAPCTCCR